MSVPSPAPARTEEMAVIHRIYRRGFPMVADLVRRTPEGGTICSESIAAHLEFLLNSLHLHHSGEDDQIWPRLLERAAPQAEWINRMETQHEVVAHQSERVRTGERILRMAPSSPRRWTSSPTLSSSNSTTRKPMSCR